MGSTTCVEMGRRKYRGFWWRSLKSHHLWRISVLPCPRPQAVRTPLSLSVQANGSGAMSVAAHLLAFNGRNDNLFRVAIMQSGAPTTGLYQSSTSEASTATYKTVLSKSGTRHCLIIRSSQPLDIVYSIPLPQISCLVTFVALPVRVLIAKVVPPLPINYP